MLLSINNYLESKVNSQKFLQLFDQMATTITGEYISRIHNHIEHYGSPPSFNEVMHDVDSLSNELKLKAEWMRDNYKENKGRRSISLTTGCKRIIKKSVAHYITQVKTISTISHSMQSTSAY